MNTFPIYSQRNLCVIHAKIVLYWQMFCFCFLRNKNSNDAVWQSFFFLCFLLALCCDHVACACGANCLAHIVCSNSIDVKCHCLYAAVLIHIVLSLCKYILIISGLVKSIGWFIVLGAHRAHTPVMANKTRQTVHIRSLWIAINIQFILWINENLLFRILDAWSWTFFTLYANAWVCVCVCFWWREIQHFAFTVPNV